MSKQEQAAQTIYHLVRNHLDIENGLSKIAATRIAQILCEEGLLAPDLPDPSRGMGTSGAVWYLPYHIGDIRRMGEHIVAFGHDCQDKPFRLVLNAPAAVAIGRTILAAAKHAEGAQSNGNV